MAPRRAIFVTYYVEDIQLVFVSVFTTFKFHEIKKDCTFFLVDVVRCPHRSLALNRSISLSFFLERLKKNLLTFEVVAR